MAVVVDLDALGHVCQFEGVSEFAQDSALRRGLSHAAVERFLGIAAGLVQKLASGPALGNFNHDFAFRPRGQSFFQQRTVRDVAVYKDPPRWRQVLVKLDEKAR